MGQDLQSGHSHPVAPTYEKELADAALKADPRAAIERLMLEKQLAENEARQLKIQLKTSEQEKAAAQKVAAELEPYMDIIRDSRTFLPIYLRDAIVWKQLVSKLRKKYGKLVDINSSSKTGRQAAHRRIDAIVEECLRYSLLNWHHILGRLEALDERSR